MSDQLPITLLTLGTIGDNIPGSILAGLIEGLTEHKEVDAYTTDSTSEYVAEMLGHNVKSILDFPKILEKYGLSLGNPNLVGLLLSGNNILGELRQPVKQFFIENYRGGPVIMNLFTIALLGLEFLKERNIQIIRVESYALDGCDKDENGDAVLVNPFLKGHSVDSQSKLLKIQQSMLNQSVLRLLMGGKSIEEVAKYTALTILTPSLELLYQSDRLYNPYVSFHGSNVLVLPYPDLPEDTLDEGIKNWINESSEDINIFAFGSFGISVDEIVHEAKIFNKKNKCRSIIIKGWVKETAVNSSDHNILITEKPYVDYRQLINYIIQSGIKVKSIALRGGMGSRAVLEKYKIRGIFIPVIADQVRAAQDSIKTNQGRVVKDIGNINSREITEWLDSTPIGNFLPTNINQTKASIITSLQLALVQSKILIGE